MVEKKQTEKQILREKTNVIGHVFREGGPCSPKTNSELPFTLCIVSWRMKTDLPVCYDDYLLLKIFTAVNSDNC